VLVGGVGSLLGGGRGHDGGVGTGSLLEMGVCLSVERGALAYTCCEVRFGSGVVGDWIK
jgi:hypothetical protein